MKAHYRDRDRDGDADTHADTRLKFRNGQMMSHTAADTATDVGMAQTQKKPNFNHSKTHMRSECA